MSSGNGNGERRSAIDPAVATLITEGDKKHALRQMPRKAQAEARRQAARERTTYDFPNGIREAVIQVAQQEGISASTAAALLLADAARRHQAGQLTFSGNGVRRPSRSPQFEYTVDDETVLDVLRGHIVLEVEEATGDVQEGQQWA